MVSLLSNPLILLLTAAVVMTAAMFLFVGRKKKKPKKIEKAIETKKVEKKEGVTDASIETDENKKTQKDDDIIEKTDKNFEKIEEKEENSKTKLAKVSKVYVRRMADKTAKTEEENDTKYEDLSNRAEFVKTSKKLSKFSSFKDEIKEEVAELVAEEIKDCEVCDEIKSRIDHSRRLKDSIKDDNFDNLFAGHITDHYMNINIEKHLTSKYEDLFKRSEELVANGLNRALDVESQKKYNEIKNDKDKLRYWLEQTRTDGQSQPSNFQINANQTQNIDLSLKNIMLTDAILKRRKTNK